MYVFRIMILSDVFTFLFSSNKENKKEILKAKYLGKTAEQFVLLLKNRVYTPALNQDIRFQIYCSFINPH